MTEHIPAEELKKLGNYELAGQELIERLEHLETCAECRGKIEKRPVERIIERLGADESENEVNKAQTVEADAQMPTQR